MSDFVSVAAINTMTEGRLFSFNVNGRRVAVAKVGDQFFAVDDLCTHDDGPLGEGLVEGCEVECPRHGARFDLKTGAAIRMPAVVGVKVHATRVTNGHLEIQITGQ